MKTLDMFSNIKAFGLIHVHRKFNCGYATHFFFFFNIADENYEGDDENISAPQI
jgi:hypothetical protein